MHLIEASASVCVFHCKQNYAKLQKAITQATLLGLWPKKFLVATNNTPVDDDLAVDACSEDAKVIDLSNSKEV